MASDIIRDPNVKITSDVRILLRTDGLFVIFDRRLPLGKDAGVFSAIDKATNVARQLYPPEIKHAATKQSDADEEMFAAMKRAMANGFRKHEPCE